MAFIGIKIPDQVSKLLSQIEVPGEKTKINEFHITLLYLGDKHPLSETYKCIESIHKVVSHTKPFSVQTKHVSHFPGWEDDDKCAVIAKVISPELHDFRAKLAETFDQDDIEFSKKFKGYKPHITLSYSKKEPKDFEIDPLSFMVSEITMWCGEEMNDRLIIEFPFGGEESSKNAVLLQKIEVFEKTANRYCKL